jgi:DNA-binding FadR family transcriptional regulator
MTNDEKRKHLVRAAVDLHDATLNNSKNKLSLKFAARDAIGLALAGTAASRITDKLKNDIVPLCEAFSENYLIRMHALAGAIAQGDESLLKIFHLQLLAHDFND